MIDDEMIIMIMIICDDGDDNSYDIDDNSHDDDDDNGDDSDDPTSTIVSSTFGASLITRAHIDPSDNRLEVATLVGYYS